jgi:hypothetical protein
MMILSIENQKFHQLKTVRILRMQKAYLALPLAAGQIDKIQLPDSDMVSSCVRLSAFDDNGEDGM